MPPLCALLADPHLKLRTGAVLVPRTQGWGVDELPLLEAGQVHEWSLATERPTGAVWYPPLMLLAALAGKLAGEDQRIVWIAGGAGRRFSFFDRLGQP